MRMEIGQVGAEKAALVHGIMMEAYAEYRDADPPSSALDETAEGIAAAMEQGKEMAAVAAMDGLPLASVRFKLDDTGLYFFRLGVVPGARGRGVARAVLTWLESYARWLAKPAIWCKVRLEVPQNVQLYQSLGYAVVAEETVTRYGKPLKVVTMRKVL